MSLYSACHEERVAHLFEVAPNGRLYRTSGQGTKGGYSDGGSVKGYRRVFVRLEGKTVSVLAHRIVAFKTYGVIGPNMTVNHKNGIRHDNRPENLEIVTNTENMQHSFRELGREGLKGEDQWNARLTEANILEIRSELRRGAHPANLAMRFGVTKENIFQIKWGRSWKHLPGAIPPAPRKRFTALQVQEIRARADAGERTTDLAREFDVSVPVISSIKHRRRYTHIPEVTLDPDRA